jgi:hypothetical protein
MPIVKTVGISQEIKTITFTDKGDMSVTLSVNGQEVSKDVTFQIGLDDTMAIIDKETTGMTIRQSIVFGLYQYLIATGKVDGTIIA